MASSTSSGLKNIYFGNLTVTDLKIETGKLNNSILLNIPNVLSLRINCLVIKNLKLLLGSYFVLGN